jgi:hypothetical protein
LKTRPEAVVDAVVLLTLGVLACDAAVSLSSGADLNLGSGVWLALARDIVDGVFYRPLWTGMEYGGTRYFPLLPLATAGLTRAGVPIVAAGLWVSMAGLAGLAVATLVLLRRLSVPWRLAALGAGLAVAPYFVHQTAFAIRSEPLAAAFAVLGMAVLAPLENQPKSSSRLGLAAGLFVCAFATKMTCVYAPVAVATALALAGRPAQGLKLAAMTAALGGLFFFGMNAASGGRALESFRACALAGSSIASFFGSSVLTRPLTLIGTSHLLTAVFLAAAVTLIARRGLWRRLPALYFIAASGITAVIFTSPGTILTSQILDAYVAAIVLLIVVVAGARDRLRALGYAAVIALAVWAAVQNIVRLAGMIRNDVVRSSLDGRRDLLAAVARCDGPILSESSLVPILAGQRPVLLDAFAFHVVAENRPEVNRHLTDRVERREFACIILEQDPATARGAAWYRNVNLTESTVNAVLAGYVYDRTAAGQRFYVRAGTVGVRFQNLARLSNRETLRGGAAESAITSCRPPAGGRTRTALRLTRAAPAMRQRAMAFFR